MSVKVADLFCGAGGSSTGARRALARHGLAMELLCVNHWDVAIETHKRNHPSARHYCQDLATVKPREAVPGGRLDLLMASPTCTYHSRARGGKPTSDQQRMDPWQIVAWLSELRVKRLIIENVPEFVEWGPINPQTGRPVQSRKGEYFRAWLGAIEAHGFTPDWRILNCADFGDATTRKRFFLIARSDSRRLEWPAPSHGPAGLDLGLDPWRAARDIIDWSIPGRSIFGRKKPLSRKTLERIYAGALKFRWPDPFLVVLRNHMDGRSVDAPLPTIAAGGLHIGPDRGPPTEGAPRAVDEPMPGMTGANNGPVLIAPYYGSGSGETCQSTDVPLPSVTTKARFAMVAPITHGDDSGRVRDTGDPLPTITGANRGELAFIAAAFGERQGQSPRIHSIDDPAPTICAQGRVNLVQPGRDFDILFRMLEPHELAAAMGFADDEIAYEFAGNKTEIIKQIGNAVPVNTAAALVGAMFGG